MQHLFTKFIFGIPCSNYVTSRACYFQETTVKTEVETKFSLPFGSASTFCLKWTNTSTLTSKYTRISHQCYPSWRYLNSDIIQTGTRTIYNQNLSSCLLKVFLFLLFTTDTSDISNVGHQKSKLKTLKRQIVLSATDQAPGNKKLHRYRSLRTSTKLLKICLYQNCDSCRLQ